MPNMTPEQYVAFQRRTAKFVQRFEDQTQAAHEVGRGGLHEQIIRHCQSQFPPWKFKHERTDKRTRSEEGSPDFVIALPGGRTIWIECKSKDAKLTTEQRAWKIQMNMLDHELHEIRSMEEFLRITR